MCGSRGTTTLASTGRVYSYRGGDQERVPVVDGRFPVAPRVSEQPPELHPRELTADLQLLWKEEPHRVTLGSLDGQHPVPDPYDAVVDMAQVLQHVQSRLGKAYHQVARSLIPHRSPVRGALAKNGRSVPEVGHENAARTQMSPDRAQGIHDLLVALLVAEDREHHEYRIVLTVIPVGSEIGMLEFQGHAGLAGLSGRLPEHVFRLVHAGNLVAPLGQQNGVRPRATT